MHTPQRWLQDAAHHISEFNPCLRCFVASNTAKSVCAFNDPRSTERNGMPNNPNPSARCTRRQARFLWGDALPSDIYWILETHLRVPASGNSIRKSSVAVPVHTDNKSRGLTYMYCLTEAVQGLDSTVTRSVWVTLEAFVDFWLCEKQDPLRWFT